MKILVVDDEPPIVQALEYNLRREGFETLSAPSGQEALDVFEREKPDLVILDVMLPGLSGVEVCRIIRRRSQIPIILLTARAEETDRVVGLEIGADDYVTKPFSIRELIARVKALLRRTSDRPAEENLEPLVCDDMVLDPARRTFSRGGKDLALAPRQFELLSVFLKRRGKALSRRELLRLAWGDSSYIDERTVDVHVRWLREKIEKDPGAPEYIQTVRGFGYRFRG